MIFKTLASLSIFIGIISVTFVSAQATRFSNELEGFKLYNRGKLTDVHLGLSGREDVKQIWGEDCEGGGCSYDEKWEMAFYYFHEFARLHTSRDGISYDLIPMPEMVGKISLIVMKPAKSSSFTKIVFPDIFEKSSETAPHSGAEILVFDDSSGLYYTTLDEGGNPGNLLYVTYAFTASPDDDRFIVVGQQTIVK